MKYSVVSNNRWLRLEAAQIITLLKKYADNKSKSWWWSSSPSVLPGCVLFFLDDFQLQWWVMKSIQEGSFEIYNRTKISHFGGVQENMERNFEIQRIVKIHSNRLEVWWSVKIVHLMFIPKQHVVDIEGEKKLKFRKAGPPFLNNQNLCNNSLCDS